LHGGHRDDLPEVRGIGENSPDSRSNRLLKDAPPAIKASAPNAEAVEYGASSSARTADLGVGIKGERKRKRIVSAKGFLEKKAVKLRIGAVGQRLACGFPSD